MKVLVTGGTSGLGLASDAADGVHDERIVAAEFERWLEERAARGEGGSVAKATSASLEVAKVAFTTCSPQAGRPQRT